MKLRTVAAAVTLLNGIWVVVTGLYWSQVFQPLVVVSPTAVSATAGSGNLVLLVLGGILVLDSAVCFLGWNNAFYISATVSLLAILGAADGVHIVSAAFAISGLLGVLTVVLDIFAARKKTFVPEADHPLNLPVFG